MTRKLKVYGWPHYGSINGDRKDRAIMAAPSGAAVARALGMKTASQVFNLSETGNDDDIATALAQPGKILYSKGYADDREHVAVDPEPGYLDPPKSKPKTERVTLWVVTDFCQDYPELESTPARKTSVQYIADKRLSGFGHHAQVSLERGDECPEDAVMRYVRSRENSAESHRKSAERADRMAAAAALLLVLEPPVND